MHRAILERALIFPGVALLDSPFVIDPFYGATLAVVTEGVAIYITGPRLAPLFAGRPARRSGRSEATQIADDGVSVDEPLDGVTEAGHVPS
jgi:hypothetical protein